MPSSEEFIEEFIEEENKRKVEEEGSEFPHSDLIFIAYHAMGKQLGLNKEEIISIMDDMIDEGGYSELVRIPVVSLAERFIEETS